MTEIVLPYTPQPKQALMHSTAARLIMYGGAVGGGKSAAVRWDLISWCLQVPGLQAYLYRRTRPELEENHIARLRREIPKELGQWSEKRNSFEFTNGSAIHCWYCEQERDVERAQGQEMHVLGIDEASHLTSYQLNYLFGRARLGDFQDKVPDHLRDLLPRVVFASNPGGPGHNYLKQTFIDPAPPMTVFEDEESGWPTIFIPAVMKDNRFIEPGYEKQFNRLSPELKLALTEGDWDAVVGQALHSLSRSKHGLRPFRPPRHWTRFMSLDWGSSKPFSVGWYCVSEGAELSGDANHPPRYLPAGAIIRYAEYYGWNGRANEGCKKTSPEVAREIIQMEREREEPPIDYRIADSACWAKHDGPSTAERMMMAVSLTGQVEETYFALQPSQKDRIAGYREVLARLADDEDAEEPMFFCTENCMNFWRTMPPLVLDQTDPEKGPDTKQEDHVYDEVVYALMSRPFVTTKRDRWDAYVAREQNKSRAHGRYST